MSILAEPVSSVLGPHMNSLVSTLEFTLNDKICNQEFGSHARGATKIPFSLTYHWQKLRHTLSVHTYYTQTLMSCSYF